jgi:hypothetical protein
MMTFFIFFTCKKSSCIPILGSPPYGQKKCWWISNEWIVIHQL